MAYTLNEKEISIKTLNTSISEKNWIPAVRSNNPICRFSEQILAAIKQNKAILLCFSFTFLYYFIGFVYYSIVEDWSYFLCLYFLTASFSVRNYFHQYQVLVINGIYEGHRCWRYCTYE